MSYFIQNLNLTHYFIKRIRTRIPYHRGKLKLQKYNLLNL